MFWNRKNRIHGRKAMHRVRCALCVILTLVMCMSVFSGVAFATPTEEEAVEAAETDGEAVEVTEAAAEMPAEAVEEDAEAEPTDDGADSTDADAVMPLADSADADAIMPLAVSGDAGISSFVVSAQVDGTAPWDSDDEPGDDSSASNDIVRTFDNVNYTLSYTTALTSPTEPVDSGTLYVEFTLPCGPEVASFNMNTLNWMSEPKVTYYLPDGSTTTDYTNGMDVDKQVLTGHRELVNTADNTAIPGTGTLSVGVYIGAATNGMTLKPEFTAWMEDNAEEDKVSVTNQETLTISAAQKYNIGIRQASEMNISGTYDLSTGNENAAKDTISKNTSVRGRMEGYGITVMMQNDSVDKGLKGLEFPTEDITFDITLSEQAENRSGDDLSDTEGYTPVIWDYDANLRKTAANGGSVGQWDRTWVYTNSNNRDCAYGAAPYNKLGCHTLSTIYDSCYDGGGWYMEQDSGNPLVYHVTISDYTIDYKDYNFPTANNTWYARTEAGTVYTANQACLSAGTTQMVLQFPENAVDAPTHIYYKMVADNFAVGGEPYDAEATYTNTYELVPEGSIQSGVNFTDDTATSRAQSGHQLGSGYMAGDAYSFLGTDIRLWGYQSTTTDEYVRTKATLIKFDADAFEINRSDQYYESGRYMHGSGEGTVHSFTRYFAGRSSNWESDQVMSDTLINSTDLYYYTDLDALESAGYTCVGVLYIADVEDINTSSQSQGMIGLTIKDEAALIDNVYAACNDSWASYSTLEELEAVYGAPISEEGGTINTDWARNGYNLYKAYCSLSVYETMKTTIESGNRGDFWYHKTEYDSDGNITGGHDVGYYGGTSLLVCGEKSTVEIKTDRTVYDMDTGQRTAEVIVTPAVTVEGNASSETGDKGTTTTTATVKVTLPFDLTYDVGTAYWGEEAITPEIIANDDGTTVLVFTLPDVTLGETLDALTFTCTIGHAGTALDVTNNESISLNATIESTNDHRAKEESFGNSSSTSFNVIRLSATSISKSVDNRMIERDGSFTWTLNYYNGGEEEITATEMADVFPTDGDELGSSFAGSYSITKIELDFSQAQTSYLYDTESLGFYVSSDYSGTGQDLANDGTEAGGTWTNLMDDDSKSVDPDEWLITFDTSDVSDMKAFYCDLGTLYTQDTIVVRIYVQTEGNDPGDLYSNLYYEAAEGQDAAVQSNLVTTQVVKRTITGRTWIDANANGIQDADEAALENATVTLYREDEVDSTAIRGLAVTQATDVYGKTVEPVQTDENGGYVFDNLPAGTYVVQFSDVNGKKYQLTEQNVGDDDTVDSDASFVSNVNNDLIAQITDLSLPAIADMDRYIYESDYNDAGYSYALIDITVSKEWDDANNQDGVRPTSITIHLFEGEGDDRTEIASETLNAADDWTWTFTDLPAYDEDGTEITYTVTEDAVDGYDTTIGEPVDTNEGYTIPIANTHEPETIDIEGTKTWDDEDNQDGERPESITISLYANGSLYDTKTVTEADGWAWTFTDLPKYASGVEIKYTITEDAVNNYKTTVNGYDVTNEHDLERMNLNVQKIWSDENNRDGVRPAEITVELVQNGTRTGQTLTLNADNDWSGGWTDLERYQEGEVGVPNEYSVYEEAISGYNGEEPLVETVGDTTTIFLTNEHDAATINIEGTKTWDDADDQDGLRPDSVTVFLYADGDPALDANNQAIRTTVTAADNWTWTFTDLPQYRDGGEEIVYTVQERVVPDGYTAAIDGDAESGFTITNTHTPAVTEVSVEKTWDDNNNQDGIRPQSITITLYADGEPAVDENGNTIQATVTAADNWAWTFMDLPKYRDHGVEIVYTITEDAVDGYDAAIGDAVPTDDGLSYDVTNTHEPGTIDISGSKTWEDDDNNDGYRPESITIRLLADGSPAVDADGNAITAEVTAEDDWAWSFTGLPQYRDGGIEIVYSITEDAIDHYTPEYNGYDVTNIHTLDLTSLTVTKAWDDADDQDGIRSESITVTLLADGEDTGRTLTLDAEDNWTGTFTELDIFENQGERVVYTVEEEDVPDGYAVTITGDQTTGYTVTNAHTPETIDISGSKTWEDDDNNDGYRPESITIRLLADGSPAVDADGNAITAEVTAENDWAWSFTGLPQYRDGGIEIVYSVTEDAIDHYTPEYSGYDVTNTHTLDLTSLTVTKAWNDSDNQDGIRPTGITVQLLADGEATGETLELNDSDGWTGTFTELDIFEDQGERIVYTVEEEDVPDGYEVTITGDQTTGYTVTNTHTPETIDISGSKTWEDDDNNDGYRPESITIRLLADGTEVRNATVTEEDGWAWSFTGLPKYRDGGTEIIYTITEDAVAEYSAEYDGCDVTNTHTPDQTSLTVTKAWNDADDQDGIRPESITVTLLADGEDTGRTLTLDAEDNWTGAFTELDMYRDQGVEIVYTVEEEDVPDGYELVSIEGDAVIGYTITNAYTPETTEVSGSKTWEDDDNNDGCRPESITIRLLADGTPAINAEGEEISATVTEEDGWAWTFTDLPKYRDGGIEIVYSVTEDAIDGYAAEYDGCDVTNTHTPDQTSLTVTKVWDDSDDQDGLRPDSVTVQLLADGEATGKTLVLDAEDNWTGTFTELAIYEDQGEQIAYTVEEEDVPDGYEAVITGDATTGYTITNTHTPEKTNTGTPTSHTGNGGSGGNGGNGGTGKGGSGTSGTGHSKTGDTAARSVMIWSLVLLAAAATAAVVFVRRRRT